MIYPPEVETQRISIPDAEQAIMPRIEDSEDVEIIAQFDLPGYGQTIITGMRHFQQKPRDLPVLADDSPYLNRAAKGRVVSPEGLPVAHALIVADNVRLRTGESLGSARQEYVITDEQGAFRIYVPIRYPEEFAGKPLEIGSKFRIEAWAPAQMGLMPVCDYFSNEETAELRFLAGVGFHRFEFRDALGLKLELEKTQGFQMRFDNKVSVPQRFLESGGNLPAGEYNLVVYINEGKSLNFDPLRIDARTTETIVMQAQGQRWVKGLVLDGRTSEPLQNAQVFAMKASSTGKVIKSGPAIDPAWFGSAYINPKGEWKIAAPRDASRIYILGLVPGYMPMEVGSFDYNSPLVLRMFPAAYLKFTARVDRNAHAQAPLKMHWKILSDLDKPWVEQLRVHAPLLSFPTILQGESQEIAIPADVDLEVTIGAREITNEEFEPLLLGSALRLRPGESIDLGDLRLPLREGMRVQLLDSANQPQAGLPLRANATLRSWENYPHFVSPWHLTDEQGFTSLYLPEEGLFEIHCDEFKPGGLAQIEWNPNSKQTDVLKITIDDESLKRIRRRYPLENVEPN